MPLDYDPFPPPVGPTAPELARYTGDELRRLADALRSDTLGFEVILNRERLLGLGYLYQVDFQPFATVTFPLPHTIDIISNGTLPMFLESSIVAYDSGGEDDLLIETFVGGTLSGGSPVVSRPLNSFTPNIQPVASANEGRTVDVAGTRIAVSAGQRLIRAAAIIPPSSEYYVTFSQIGAGQPPTNVQPTIQVASVEPYPIR